MSVPLPLGKAFGAPETPEPSEVPFEVSEPPPECAPLEVSEPLRVLLEEVAGQFVVPLEISEPPQGPFGVFEQFEVPVEISEPPPKFVP